MQRQSSLPVPDDEGTFTLARLALARYGLWLFTLPKVPGLVPPFPEGPSEQK